MNEMNEVKGDLITLERYSTNSIQMDQLSDSIRSIFLQTPFSVPERIGTIMGYKKSDSYHLSYKRITIDIFLIQ
jgi:hypothetical protein